MIKFFARYISQHRKGFKREELWFKYHEKFTVSTDSKSHTWF